LALVLLRKQQDLLTHKLILSQTVGQGGVVDEEQPLHMVLTRIVDEEVFLLGVAIKIVDEEESLLVVVIWIVDEEESLLVVVIWIVDEEELLLVVVIWIVDEEEPLIAAVIRTFDREIINQPILMSKRKVRGGIKEVIGLNATQAYLMPFGIS
jgi:hypothetical protein